MLAYKTLRHILAKLYPTPLITNSYTMCKNEHEIARYSMYMMNLKSV